MNPFDGITPDVGVFGIEFNSLWGVLLAGLWGLGFVFFAVKLIAAFIAVRDARQHSNVADYGTAFSSVKMNGLGLLGLTALPVIFAAINAVMAAA